MGQERIADTGTDRLHPVVIGVTIMDEATGQVSEERGKNRSRWLVPLGYFWVALLFYFNNDGLFSRLLAVAVILFSASQIAVFLWRRRSAGRPSGTGEQDS